MEFKEMPKDSDFDNSDLPLWFKGVIIALLFIITCAAFYQIEKGRYQSKYTSRFVWGKDCEFQPPDGWQLQTDGNHYIFTKDGGYAIECLTQQRYYSNNPVDLSSMDVYDPILFSDTCSAKACLKYFIEQEKKEQANKVKQRFKPI